MEMKYTLIYAKRKTVSMRIDKNGELIVRAPLGTPKNEIERIIKKHSARLDEIKARVLTKESTANNSDPAELESRLKRVALPLLEKHSRNMGIAPSKVTFTNAKTRFGSCSSKKRICFSRYLALYPDDAIEYVVVHELAHLVEMNHSKRFYAIVEKHLPDWKRRKVLLRKSI
ncbi:MAG: M48 family metallopeptidase [Clostridia bacterium]|nr:M48 family metallopeptidase [Clostridia bacterium]